MTLKHRLLFLTLMSSTVSLAFAAVVFLTYEFFELRQELRRDVTAYARLLAHGVGPALARGDMRAATRALDPLSDEEHVVAASLLAPGGRLLARYVRDIGEPVAPEPGARDPAGMRAGLVHASHPVVHEGEILGELVVAASPTGIVHHLLREVALGGALIIPAFIVAFLGTLRLQRRSIEPMETLVRSASRELGVDVETDDTADEIGLLSRSFERMVEELREREREIAEAERHFRALIENSADYVVVLDADGIVRYNGPSCERDFGFESGALLGTPFVDHVHPQDRTRLREALLEVIEQPGRRFAAETRFVVAGNREHVLECIGRNELDTPAVNGVIVNCRDITDRRASERALSESEQRYRELLEHAADAFFVHDRAGKLLDVNQRACDSLGYTREELLSMSVPDFEMNMARSSVHGIWDTMVPGVPVTIQGCHRHKDGSTFPVEVRVGMFATSTDGQSRLVALARDTSERLTTEEELKRARDAAQEADRAKSLFLANVSHEIRTPLTAILGMSELLGRNTEAEDRHHCVDVIRGSCDALMSVIDGLLDLSRAEAGSLTLDTVDFDPWDLVEGVQDMLGTTAHSKGLSLVTLVEPDVPRSLVGDPDRLRQVLTNLLANAVKFTDQGHVRLRLAVMDEREDSVLLHVSVRDSGIGISEAERPQLFDAFVRGDSVLTRRQRGAGLGLSISKFLVEKMDGSIGAQRNVGAGSTFWCTCRLARSDRPVDAVPSCAAVRGKKLLIADASEEVREVLAEQALQWGLLPTTAANVDEALASLREAARTNSPFPLVLADLFLDGTPGVALSDAVVSDAALATTHVVLMIPVGSRLEPAIEALARRHPHLAKPLRQSRLGPSLAQFLEPDSSVPAQVPPSEQEARAAQLREARAPVVLLAEDDPVNREALRLLLDTFGCDVETVTDGEQAVEAVGRTRFDVVLMDWQMPKMDGLQATAAIRELESTARHTRIVAVTASGSPAERELCVQAGMDDFLRKPVTLAEIERVLDGTAPRTQADGEGPAVVDIPPETLHQILALFTEHSRSTRELMRAALAAGDVQALGRHAHALAGASRQVQAKAVARACKTLGHACERGDLSEARSQLRTVEAALDAALDETAFDAKAS